MKRVLLFIFVFALAIGAGLFGVAPYINQAIMNIPEPDFYVADSPEPEPAYTDIEIACVGDILLHEPVFSAAKTGQTDASGAVFDFRSQFAHVKPLLEKADLTIANLEGTLAGAAQKYSGYPQFNSPDAIVDTLKDTGVDILTNANNHCMDRGQTGFYRTIDTVRAQGLDIIGTRKTADEPPYVIKTVKGVKVGVINYGYAFESSGGLQVNGLPMPDSMKHLLNYIDYSRLSSELPKLHTAVSDIREEGIDILVVCMHWGNEYHLHSDTLQQRAAQELANLKVDIVFGGHPHVLQEAAYVAAQDGDHKTLVYYSLGNFISNQRLETLNNINTEHGLIAQVTLRHHSEGNNEILSSGYTATWVNKATSHSRTVYEIIPANQALENAGQFPNLSSASRSRLETCQSSADKLMTAIRP